MIVPAAEIRMVLTTVDSRDEAEQLGRSLVEERLAACVNIVPGLTSIYRWKGTIESASEFLLIIKATASSLEPLEAALRRLHSYDVPEFVVLAPESAAQSYLSWLIQESAPNQAGS